MFIRSIFFQRNSGWEIYRGGEHLKEDITHTPRLGGGVRCSMIRYRGPLRTVVVPKTGNPVVANLVRKINPGEKFTQNRLCRRERRKGRRSFFSNFQSPGRK